MSYEFEISIDELLKVAEESLMNWVDTHREKIDFPEKGSFESPRIEHYIRNKEGNELSLLISVEGKGASE